MIKQRRTDLLQLLKTAETPLNGQILAEKFHVTRQIIVQDIAVLRADGAPIISTNRGYIYKTNDSAKYYHQLFKVKHTIEDIEAELLAIVDNGGRVQNIMVEHPVYGEIQTYLKLTCRRDVQHFIQQIHETNFRGLSELTDGVHYHLVEADSQQDLDYVEKALEELGGEVIGVACIADRTSAPIGMPIYSAIKLDIQVHEADDCPLCKEGKIELIKPGSREFKEIGM